jgi:hypothetical protein
VSTRAGQAHSLLHCHFESAVRALAVAWPGELKRLRPVLESPDYARAAPAGRLSMLDGQVSSLAHGQDIFTRDVFAEVVRRLAGEMTSSGIRHVDRTRRRRRATGLARECPRPDDHPGLSDLRRCPPRHPTCLRRSPSLMEASYEHKRNRAP